MRNLAQAGLDGKGFGFAFVIDCEFALGALAPVRAPANNPSSV